MTDLRDWQLDVLMKRLPSFDPEKSEFLFGPDQPEHPGKHPRIMLANDATWYPDPFSRPVNAARRPLKVKAKPGPRRYLVGPGTKDASEVILVEGELDAAAFSSNDFDNVICVGGIEAMLSDHPTYIGWRRDLLAGKDVVIAFDFDDQGRSGAFRVARKLLEESTRTGVGKVSILKPMPGWPGGCDLADFVANQGARSAERIHGELLRLLGRREGPFGRAEDVPDAGTLSVGSVVHDIEATRLLTWDEFQAAHPPPALVKDLIYAGSTHVINGASKAGKSVLMNQLALCVAGGADFLELPVEQAPVLLLSLEMNAGIVRDRLESIASDVRVPAADPQWFHIVAPVTGRTPQIDLTGAAGVATLRQLITDSGAKLVILDTLYRFMPGADPNDNGEMGKLMGSLNTVASDTGAALVLIHHTAKGRFEGETSQSGLGAQILGGAANVIIRLTKAGQVKPRWNLSVASHYASWDQDIHYARPEREDGSSGMGCVRTTATGARDLGREDVERVFREHGTPVGTAFKFDSKNAFVRAALDAGLAESESGGKRLVEAFVSDFSGPNGPLFVASGIGQRGANTYGWPGEGGNLTHCVGTAAPRRIRSRARPCTLSRCSTGRSVSCDTGSTHICIECESTSLSPQGWRFR